MNLFLIELERVSGGPRIHQSNFMSLSQQAGTGYKPEQAISCAGREDNGKLLAITRQNGRTARLDVKGKSSHARIGEMPHNLSEWSEKHEVRLLRLHAGGLILAGSITANAPTTLLTNHLNLTSLRPEKLGITKTLLH